MSLLRWLPTFLAYPLGGLIAMLLLGSAMTPWAAVLGGTIVGAVVGAAQWLALRPAVGPRWIIATVIAVPVGAITAALVVGPPVTAPAAALTGAIIGAAAGIAQAFALPASIWPRVAWAATVAVSWTAGWLITSAVIVDLDRGHFIFGSSGAAVVTIVTGVVLRSILGARPRKTAGQTEAPAPVEQEA